MLKFLLFYEVWTVLCWGRPVVANGDDTWILPPQTLFTLKARHIWCPRSPNKRCLTLNTRSWRNKPHRNLIILASEIWPIGKDVHSNLLEHTVHMLEDFMTVQNCSCQLCQIYHVKSKVVQSVVQNSCLGVLAKLSWFCIHTSASNSQDWAGFWILKEASHIAATTSESSWINWNPKPQTNHSNQTNHHSCQTWHGVKKRRFLSVLFDANDELTLELLPWICLKSNKHSIQQTDLNQTWEYRS